MINKLAIVKKHSKIDYENELTIICDLFRQGSELFNSTCTLSPSHLLTYLQCWNLVCDLLIDSQS